MYPHLLATHSALRWIALIFLLVTLIKSWMGYKNGSIYGKGDQRLASITARFFELQFLVGVVLYFVSPAVKYFWSNLGDPFSFFDGFFFAIIHLICMLAAVGFVSTAAAKSKKAETDIGKFRVVAVMLSVSLILILIAVPWPGSPLAERPMFRPF